VLELHPRDIRRTGLMLPDPGDARSRGMLIRLTGSHSGLATELCRWARANALEDDEPLFFSREREERGRRKAIDRVRAWQIVTTASQRALTRAGLPVAHRRRPAAEPHRTRAEAPRERLVDQLRLGNTGPPLVRARLVSRPRLVETLNELPRHSVALVVAPAGFGKTTTLSTWASQVDDRLTVAWLSLGIGHNDPVRFWRWACARVTCRATASESPRRRDRGQ
jgi:hypothetical protein